jgi:ADP-ribose pyrophosphatase YjhB (NUDIX family)
MVKNRSSTGMDFGVRVAAVIERGDLLLLVRHQKPGRDPYWVLPGGRLEPGETIPECAVREVREETGLRAAFSGALYVGEFLREGRHTVDVTVRMIPEDDAEASLGADPEVAPDAEPTLSELRWVGAEELRGIDLLPASLKERLLRDAPDGWAANEVYLEGGRR